MYRKEHNHKTSFKLYTWYIELIDPLSRADTGLLFMAILEFVNGNEEPEINNRIEDAYNLITDKIVEDWAKYNPKTKRYHHNWKGGISPENKLIRNGVEIKLWRISVFKRDKYTCQKCGQVGGVLHAHHLKEFALFPELRTELSNGLTVCKPCHINIHRKNG